MKKNTLLMLTLITIIAFQACKKADEITITDDNLTTCPVSFSCEYKFSDNSSVDSSFKLQAGKNRVFVSQAKQVSPPYQMNSLFFIAPQDDKNFILNASDIVNGKVKYIFGCPSCCFPINLIPTGGFVKGVNLTPAKITTQSKWLIEAQIILSANNQQNKLVPYDTLFIKQYFYPSFVSN